jgi:hypothetical protein
MNICNHGTDISSGIRFIVGWEFDWIQILVGGWVEMLGISFVEGIDFTPGGDLDFGMGKDEFS